MVQRRRFAISPMALIWLSVLGIACGAGSEGPETALGGNPSGAGASAGASGSAGAPSGAGGTNPLGRSRCQAPAGVSASPTTIEEAVQLLNALPKPTSVACFVESLARPLTVYATSSTFSAQPALSGRSPRVFVKLDRLWLSVVVAGQSSYLMEFGYLLEGPELRSIKGEVHLPIDQPVAPSAPYDRVLRGDVSVCGMCHYGEQRVAGITFANAFSSIAFRPRPEGKVALTTLRAEHDSCDWLNEPQRCDMLSALFDGGPVVESTFPDSMVTFF